MPTRLGVAEEVKAIAGAAAATTGAAVFDSSGVVSGSSFAGWAGSVFFPTKYLLVTELVTGFCFPSTPLWVVDRILELAEADEGTNEVTGLAGELEMRLAVAAGELATGEDVLVPADDGDAELTV